MTNRFNIYEFLKTRPLSWSALSSFEYDPEQWYRRYVLAQKEPATPEMEFGKLIGERLASDPKFMTAIPRLKMFEYKLLYTFGKGKTAIPLVGYIDAYSPPRAVKKEAFMDEYKTGKTGPKQWSQHRADTHGQIDMYLFLLFFMDGIHPEKVRVRLWWMPTQQNGDFSISFVHGENHAEVFHTARSMVQVLEFGKRIQDTVKQMELFVNTHS